MSSNSVSLSLDGIRVVDLSRVIAGPFCGALLGDMGADVIKVEDTQGGDEARAWLPQKEGQAAAYIVNNRNKRGIAVDLKDPEGAEIYLKSVGDYVATGQPVNFYTVTEAARRRGETALGYRIMSENHDAEKSYGVHTNPNKSEKVVFTSEDKLIVIAEG